MQTLIDIFANLSFWGAVLRIATPLILGTLGVLMRLGGVSRYLASSLAATPTRMVSLSTMSFTYASNSVQVAGMSAASMPKSAAKDLDSW